MHLIRIFFVVVALAVLGMIPHLAVAGSMEKTMNAALQGPEKKKLKIYDHEFNVKPVEIHREGTRLIVNGHISHHLSFRPDDQIYYRIIKDNDSVLEIKRKINRGGWAGIASPIVAAAGTYFTGVPIPPEDVEQVGRAIGRVQDGSWEGACDAIIANIALRVK